VDISSKNIFTSSGVMDCIHWQQSGVLRQSEHSLSATKTFTFFPIGIQRPGCMGRIGAGNNCAVHSAKLRFFYDIQKYFSNIEVFFVTLHLDFK
jgi:hypothetical protein